MGFLDRFRRKKEEPVVEKQKPVDEVREKPRGLVASVTQSSQAALSALLAGATSEHTDAELRTAATLPLVAGIIRTIIREVESYTLVVREKDPSDDDRPKKMLEQTLLYPNEIDRTARVALEGGMRDWLILGRTPIQLLRTRPGKAYQTAMHQAAQDFLAGIIDEDEFDGRMIALKKWLAKAVKTPGPILGYIFHAPEHIEPNVTNAGVYRKPAFYDISQYGPYAKYLTSAQKRKLKPYTKDQMALIQYTGETHPDKRLRSSSPTNDAYILIDIMFAMLVLLRDKLNKPQMDKLVSFTIPKDAKHLRDKDVDNIVAALREDLGYGRLPVLQGVLARVSEIGMGDSFQLLWAIIQQIEVYAWQIFGAGGVQMIRMEGQGRQAASQQIEASKRQGVAKALRVIEEDFIDATILRDPYSPYKGLAVEWVDKSKIPSRAEKMEKEWVPLMKDGLPIWSVLESDYPEVIAQLVAAGIDPKELLPPVVVAAMLKQAAGGGE